MNVTAMSLHAGWGDETLDEARLITPVPPLLRRPRGSHTSAHRLRKMPTLERARVRVMGGTGQVLGVGSGDGRGRMDAWWRVGQGEGGGGLGRCWVRARVKVGKLAGAGAGGGMGKLGQTYS